MPLTQHETASLGVSNSRFFAFSLSFFRDCALRRQLRALGAGVRVGWPARKDTVLVWGRKPVARRGQWIAGRTGAALITLEDGFLRSVRTGRDGAPGRSLVVDRQGIYFETDKANDLADLISESGVLSDAQLARAGKARGLLQDLSLSKYNDFPDTCPDLPENFVLVVDQTRGDASIAGAGATDETFAEMLATARNDHPDATILIKTHPETQASHRAGHFSNTAKDDRVRILDTRTNPWPLLDAAHAVYVVSSLMGLEAILAGQKPVVFGDAFYAGLGLSDDRHPRTQPRQPRTADQLFHACYLQYCHWFTANGAPSTFEEVAYSLSAEAEAAKDRRAWVLYAMRLWKRGFLRRYLGHAGAPVRFAKVAVDAPNARHAAWAGKADALQVPGIIRVEDGFLRSAGLGAELVPPLSLAFDDIGIYYDPTRPSRLEQLITARANLTLAQTERARALRDAVCQAKLSKYNLLGNRVDIVQTERPVLLVPGQVEDDASIQKGAQDVRTNLSLLQAARAAFPKAHILYKTHPDVSAGLRTGAIAEQDLYGLADQIVDNAPIADLLDQVDRVATITSLTGFEALLRGVPVTCFGLPFYAGWGLTDDRGQGTDRRQVKVSLETLIHASLIDYPSYWDPDTATPISVEEAIRHLQKPPGSQSAGLRLLSKIQGVLASRADLWRS